MKERKKRKKDYGKEKLGGKNPNEKKIISMEKIQYCAIKPFENIVNLL